MEKISCFSFRIGKKKKDKVRIEEPLKSVNYNEGLDILKVEELKLTINSPPAKNSDQFSFTAMSKIQAEEKDNPFMNRNSCEEEEEEEEGCSRSSTELREHASDPGIPTRAEFLPSPKLKRSCSNIETGFLLPKKVAQPFDQGIHCNTSVISQRSADQVMLKKHSSSQVLPSRSKKLWRRLFLWNHRNSHKPSEYNHHLYNFHKQGGYCSDTPKDNQNINSREVLQNQWVAFSTESSLSSSFRRVEEWVKGLETLPPIPLGNCGTDESPRGSGDSHYSSSRHRISKPNNNFNLSDEGRHANNIIQSLNSSSSVAHISGIGLKVVPSISCFSGLRSVNLSSNFIVHITPGSLPKGLHALNLSKNRISTIEGLRELTRLRILDLSYNRVCRIGHGLSNCRMMKELYLTGNKVSDVEGLHRLLKLTILDLSFNKITTTQALGQLVANYNSLLALNLLGNPIQTNIFSQQHLQKTILNLLPNILYLNKQPIKPRDFGTDRVAKIVLGNGDRRWSSKHRKVKSKLIFR